MEALSQTIGAGPDMQLGSDPSIWPHRGRFSLGPTRPSNMTYTITIGSPP